MFLRVIKKYHFASRLWYDELVGGVLILNREEYLRVNGYSNQFWAWGGEDDDMGLRLKAENITIARPDNVCFVSVDWYSDVHCRNTLVLQCSSIRNAHAPLKRTCTSC